MKTLCITFGILFFTNLALFGQTRTTPIISASNHGGNREMQKEDIVYVNDNTLVLKITKSTECAILDNINALDSDGNNLEFAVNKNEYKKLRVDAATNIKLRFVKNIINTKIKLVLGWNLDACNIQNESSSLKTIKKPNLNENNKNRSDANVSTDNQTYEPIDYWNLNVLHAVKESNKIVESGNN